MIANIRFVKIVIPYKSNIRIVFFKDIILFKSIFDIISGDTMITSPHSKSKVYRDIIKSRSILSQMGYLKINYGDFQGLKPSPQHVYK